MMTDCFALALFVSVLVSSFECVVLNEDYWKFCCLVDCFFHPDDFCSDWYVDCNVEVSIRNFLRHLLVGTE